MRVTEVQHTSITVADKFSTTLFFFMKGCWRLTKSAGYWLLPNTWASDPWGMNMVPVHGQGTQPRNSLPTSLAQYAPKTVTQCKINMHNTPVHNPIKCAANLNYLLNIKAQDVMYNGIHNMPICVVNRHEYTLFAQNRQVYLSCWLVALSWESTFPMDGDN